MDPETSNRILTGLAFMQTKASHYMTPATTDQSKTALIDAGLRRLQHACTEASVLLRTEGADRLTSSAHHTFESLLADGVLTLFAAAHSADIQLASAVLKRLVHAEEKAAFKHSGATL